jgi:hypothetical protein
LNFNRNRKGIGKEIPIGNSYLGRKIPMSN